MRIDLHTHSTRSDGTDDPAVLVRKARQEAELDVVALTDHDSTAGWAEASEAADAVGIRLVRGIEISTRYRGASVHLLGYEFDPDYAPLVDELHRVIAGRDHRLPLTVAKLNELGYELTVEDVHAAAEGTVSSGRPHIADALVAKGYVRNRDEAFATLLTPGKPAYIDRYAADLFRAVRLVQEAGGRAVIAHPWARESRRLLGEATFAELAALGLAGIEVDHQDHDARARAELAAIADRLDLVTTGSSDYHGSGKTGFDLGCNTTAPDQFERLLG
ncbi:PHP domain-containing protein [Aeromicrobium phragmitis]|uniref:PHP domain-containing protein n=1 Tax=Aeromicrobium phragmitis TaxID=2478914 RepID=A0A3L8PIU4_9ACTN|nr:PHP domain-containing protein [Aeromicrobium phragmitis]RLV54659.1 PHP domain-containing protein [Aeromicrobium phragmitis]